MFIFPFYLAHLICTAGIIRLILSLKILYLCKTKQPNNNPSQHEENIILGGIGCPWLANASPRRGAKQAETFCNKGQDKTHNEVSRRSWKHDDWANVYRMARLAGEHP